MLIAHFHSSYGPDKTLYGPDKVPIWTLYMGQIKIDMGQIKLLYLAISGQFFIWPYMESISGPDMACHIWAISGFYIWAIYGISVRVYNYTSFFLCDFSSYEWCHYMF